MDRIPAGVALESLADVLEADRRARDMAAHCMTKLARK
jgi:hypothetical protein